MRDQSTKFEPGAPWVPCAACGGQGEVAYNRCPSSLVDPETNIVIAAWANLRADRGWPVPGGYTAQAAAFVDAVGILDLELGLIREEQSKTREEKNK